ncbi:MAG: hypothetical protein AAGB04_26100, partial [Pseudomonadota bacterium]
MLIICCLVALLTATVPTAPKAGELGQVGSYFLKEYNARLVLPFDEVSTFGKRQVGALFTELRFDKLGDHLAFDYNRALSCIESVRTFEKGGSTSNKSFVINVKNSRKNRSDFARAFDLPNPLVSSLERIRLNFSDIAVVAPEKGDIFESILTKSWSDKT